VAIGRVVKPQGRKGEFVVEPFSDRPDRFQTLSRVYVSAQGGLAREARVESSWPHKGRFVLKLVGVDSINGAEAYRGLELLVGEEELAALPAGSYYHHQLRGLPVFDRGTSLGVVAELMETGGVPVLVVRGSQGETLVPLAEAIVRSVDLAAGRIDIEMPETVEAK
jgi:16S rRNA processing protein RimM